MFRRCKKDQFFECYSPALQFSIDTGYEFENCARHMPTCYKNREVCLGSCGGEDVQLKHDFATTVIKRELSTETLGTDDVPKARANCTLKTQVVEVPVFEGGDSLKVYSSYLRVVRLHSNSLFSNRIAEVSRSRVRRDPA